MPPDQTRATVASLAKAGVDGIKTVIQVSPGGPEIATLTLIVQEAKRFNLPVITHAVSVDDTLAAVEAGVQSLAHTPHIGQLTLAQAQMVAKAGIPMMSTLGVFVPYFDASEHARSSGIGCRSPGRRSRAAGKGPVNARLVWEAGIDLRLRHRHDAGCRRESLALELRPLSLTFSPKDIVSILTSNAAAAVAEDRPRHARSRQARRHRRAERRSARERVEPAERRDGHQGRRGRRRRKVAEFTDAS